MTIKLAKTAGFCMGVKRAVDVVLDMAGHRNGEAIYTYGPLIHNPQTVELLRKRGIIPIRSLDEIDCAPAGAAMVIRAHGISPAERKKIKEKGFRIIDATCPKVAHVQAIIRKHVAAGFTVLIAGDWEHPEVNGLLGFAGEAGIVLGVPGDVDRLPALPKVCVVAQTTQSLEDYAAIVRRVKERFPEAVIFDTICDSTETRQTEIKALAAGTDAVFIVGGRNSANTRRLAELARLQGKPAFHIETSDELQGIDIEPYRRIGVSAGASTPNWIIDRVVDHLTGRLGKREELLRHLFKIWVFAVRTDIYSAAGAGCLSFAAMLLQGLPVNPLPILTASLYVYAMHVLNRFINRKASSISSFREESYLLHEKIYMTLAVFSMILALGASFIAGPRIFHSAVCHLPLRRSLQYEDSAAGMAVSEPEGYPGIEEHRHRHRLGGRHGAAAVDRGRTDAHARGRDRLPVHCRHRLHPFRAVGYPRYPERPADRPGDPPRPDRREENPHPPPGNLRPPVCPALCGPSGRMVDITQFFSINLRILYMDLFQTL